MVQNKEQDEAAKPLGKRKGRSPGYPAIDLKTALEKARAIYLEEGRHEADEQTVFKRMGYSGRSGASAVVLAALKSFGLLDTNKTTGKLKLSGLALRILLDTREDETEKRVAISEAARRPSMHQHMWEKYGADLPSEANMLYHLTMEKDFTAAGAKAFLAQYRETLSFAGLDFEGTMPPAGGVEHRLEERGVNPDLNPPGRINLPPPAGTREIPIPIPGAAWPSIRAAFPLTEEAWTQMLEVLKAMKPGLVAVPKKDEPAGD